MTPEELAEDLRLRLPHTEIVLGDRPGRVVVKMAPKPYPLTVFIALSKSGDRAEVGDTDPTQRPRDGGGKPVDPTAIMDQIARVVDAYTTPSWRSVYQDPKMEPRIRAWAGLPDMPPSLKDRARALLNADRKAAAKVREDLRRHEEDIAALERALGVTP